MFSHLRHRMGFRCNREKNGIHGGAPSLRAVLMQGEQDEGVKEEFYYSPYACCILVLLIRPASLWRAVVIHQPEYERLKGKGCVTLLVHTPSSISFIPPERPSKCPNIPRDNRPAPPVHYSYKHRDTHGDKSALILLHLLLFCL